jgi:RND superfamily putative drug exporter
LTVGAVLVVLLVLAYPLLHIDLNESTLLQLPKDNQARVGTTLAGQIAGPGSTGPTLVLVQFDSGTITTLANQQALGEVQAVLSGQPSVAQVKGPQPSTDGAAALYSVPLKYYAESDQAKSAVEVMRDQLAASPAAAVAQISVGGLAASEVDFRNSIADSMWEIVVFILGTSFLILLVLLRSLVLPLIGVAMNVLCVGAAYGIQVAIFQWGWLPFLGFQDFGFVNSVILPLLLAIVFGLSMDYQVFLLTRIKERAELGMSAREAAREGAGVAAHTVAAAATIMIGVFVVFVIFGVPTIQAAGLGAAIAVAASAFLVQLAFMPALIVLIGDRTFWIPAWLHHVLPRIGQEPSSTLSPAPAASPPP